VLSFVAVGLVAAVLGVLVGRWWMLIVAACVWPLFFSGLHAGWWGSGVGESWAVALVLLILISIVGAALGVVAARILAPRRRFIWRASGRRLG
jgi:hypothetical protein